MISRMWNDSVWSKVFAAMIIAVMSMLFTTVFGGWPSIIQFSQDIYALSLESTLVANWALAIVIVCCIAYFGEPIDGWQSMGSE